MPSPLQLPDARPLSESATVPLRDSVPAGTVSGGEDSTTVGGVLSTLTVMEAVAELSAFVATPDTVWAAVSTETTTGGGHTVALVHVKVTVTSVLLQPASFGVGQTCAETVTGPTSSVV